MRCQVPRAKLERDASDDTGSFSEVASGLIDAYQEAARQSCRQFAIDTGT
jgi:hypothetical protein